MSKKIGIFTDINGNNIEVDISEKACAYFGFKPGQRVKHTNLGLAIVKGVAKGLWCDSNTDVLWCQLDDDEEGMLSYTHPMRLIKI